MTFVSYSSRFSCFMRQAWGKSVLYRFTLMRGPVPKHLTVIPTDPWPGNSQAGRLLLDGKFILADQVICMTDLWMPKEVDSAILADLHGFAWLRDLRALGDNSARRLARQLITNWIERNQDWHLYPWQVGITGHRVANWIALYDFFCSSADESFRSLFFREITRQVRHLLYVWQDAEVSLDRLFALKGLLYAAIAFPGESSKLSSLLLFLEKELQEQLLADGGHKSRCPQTHLIVLRDLIDIRAMLRLISHEIPEFLQASINKMAPIVRLFRHGDGGLATFNSVFPIPSPVIDMVLSLADVRGRPPERALSLGFERCLNKSSLLLVNVGAKVTGMQPILFDQGTGSLNFEWSIGRDRFIVQGDLILQTSEGQIFQMPSVIDQKSVQLRRASQDGHTLLDITYRCPKNLSFSHRRQLYLGGNQPNLRGEDTIQVSCPAVYGLRFILHKEIEASIASGGRGILIRRTSLSDGEKPTQKQEELQWRLLVSGVDEMSCEPCDTHQAILLFGQLQAHQPASIQWAFCQD